ncbi:FMN-binding protein [Cellulomonas sp. URHE0023]|uniref:FMN-binding protein n=1 Tax=Cellulomonas sp. URHE0023 TaxID=1380354 RepID=UPI0004817C20|nr:FMN-binding protein [Cellulomonas sp. URHE0023]
MATRPWRGTLIFVGTAAAMAAAGISRFAGVVPQPAAPASASGVQSAGSTTPTPSSGSTSDGSSATGTGSGATSDTVTIVGSVVQNRYGAVQVAVTFSGSQITSVQTLQTPSRERESAQISERAVPALAQEVVAAQSAHIDTVSGATYTSQGYRESVQSTIDQRG